MTKLKSVINNLSRIQRMAWVLISIAILALSVYYFSTIRQSGSYNVDFSTITEEIAEEDTKLMVRGISLRKGDYNISVGYVSDTPAQIDIVLENDSFKSGQLSATDANGNTVSYDFTVRMGTDRGRIDITYPSGADLKLAYITISSDKPLYYDGIIWGIILLLLIPTVWMMFYFYNKSTHKLSLIIAIAVVAIQIIPFIFNVNMPVGVDSKAHMMRIEGIYYGLLDGQFPVVVYPEWNNSYGQIGVLYPNVFLYIPALFRIMGMSQLGVCKLHIFTLIVVSALISLASARTIFRREWQIGLCVIALTLEDIRLWDLLHRGRLGGASVAEMFLPLVVAGLIELLYRNRRKWYLLAYGIAGIFCCHITSATVICVGAAIFVIFAAKRLKDWDIIKRFGYAILLFLGLTLGTFVSFLVFYFGDWGRGNLQWRDFLGTLWMPGVPDAHKWVSVFVIAAMCYIGYIVLAARKHLDLIKGSFMIPLTVSATLLTWMSTALFPWKILRNMSVIRYYTDMLQSGDRFLAIAQTMFVFCIPGILEAVIKSVGGRRSYQSKTTIATVVATAILAAFSITMNEYSFFMANGSGTLYYDNVIGDVETEAEDYLPAGTKTEWYKSDSGYISDEEAVQSLAYEREGSYTYYSYTNSKDGAYAEFPKFYYNGYVAEDEMAEDVPVYRGDHNRVRVYLKTTDTPAIIRIWYHVPWWMTFAAALSLGLWIASLMIVGIRIKNRID